MQKLREDIYETVDLLQKLLNQNNQDFTEIIELCTQNPTNIRERLEELQYRSNFVTTRGLYCLNATIHFLDKLKGVLQIDDSPKKKLENEILPHQILTPLKVFDDTRLDVDDEYLLRSLTPDPQLKKTPRKTHVPSQSLTDKPGILERPERAEREKGVLSRTSAMIIGPKSPLQKRNPTPVYNRTERPELRPPNSPRGTYRSRSMPPEEGKVLKREIQQRKYPSVLAPNAYPSLRIDEPVMGGLQECKLEIITDLYSEMFYNFEHYNYIITEERGTEHIIVSVLAQSIPSPIRHKLLKTTKKNRR